MPNLYTVELHHDGKVHTLEVPEDQTILRAAYAVDVDLPSSCCAGVCTTCAAQILDGGKVAQEDAMGLGPELLEDGYALLCVSYPRSDLKIETGKEAEVYERQFGQSQS
jgi:ferredoxin